MTKVSAILLAGGIGTRMQASTPKQFIELDGKPIALHSAEIFLKHPTIHELIIVCHPDYRHHFASLEGRKTIKFALPGDRRQDSVFNGFQQVSTDTDIICVHDSARPFITSNHVKNVIDEAIQHQAATLGVPLKFTIKKGNDKHIAVDTPDRSLYWEIQTPQALQTALMHKGFHYVNEHRLTVTDDVSLAEAIHHPVKLVLGSDDNFKITTPLDLIVAQQLIENRNRHA